MVLANEAIVPVARQRRNATIGADRRLPHTCDIVFSLERRKKERERQREFGLLFSLG